MDTTPLASGAVVRHVLRFEGKAGEYFRIWIVNLALTILTLGIFSAWAKIRTKRYLYGNTYIGAHAFDYHASPWRILLGRVIALALLLGYSITGAIAPKFVLAWLVIFLVALPWLVKSSLRFNARNTSYRNIRFNFHGTYGGALKAFILWPILAYITLFTTLPLAHRARDYYNINNHSFGGKNFETVIPGGRIYLIYLLGLAICVGGMIAIGLAIAGATGGIHFVPGSNHLPSINPAAIPAVVIAMAIYIFIVILVPILIHTMTFNLALSRTKLGNDYQLEAKLSPLAMTWILFSNLVATLLTLGLLYPWARVRQTRYMAGRIAISGPEDMSDFVSNVSGAPGAVGEEIAGFFDIDFGL
jgi:uncharacterized membrane protein YjgN (DUF898 family)